MHAELFIYERLTSKLLFKYIITAHRAVFTVHSGANKLRRRNLPMDDRLYILPIRLAHRGHNFQHQLLKLRVT